MRLMLFFSAFLLVFTSAIAQELNEITPIEPGGTVSEFSVEKTSANGQPLLFAFLRGGGLYVYNSRREVVLNLSNVGGWVFWGNSFLHNNKLYFFSEGLQTAEFQGTTTRVTKLNSRALQRSDYDSFLATIDDSLQVLLASYPNGVDVYRFPSLELIAQLSREEELRYSPCLLWHRILVAAVRKNRLVGYDIGLKQIKWTLNTGEYHPKLLGISIGTVPRRINQWKINQQDQLLYVSTFDGSLYKLSPQTGSIELQRLQFQGGGNNAGLLTRLYFLDVTGDSRNDLIAPSVDNNVYCINPEDLSVRWAYDTDGECQMPLAFHDVTGDNNPEIFCVNDYDLNLSIIDGTTGRCLREYSLKDGSSYKQIRIAVADLNGDGSPELLAQSSTWKKIRIFQISRTTSPR